MRQKITTYHWYALCVIAYAALTLLPVPSTEVLRRYHLTITQVRLLDITIIVPLAAIWFAAFYGYERLRRYTHLVRNSPDGKPMAAVSRGILFLALSLPLSSIASSMFTFITTHNPQFRSTGVVLSNYLSALLPLLGFLCISMGARRLTILAKARPRLLATDLAVLIVIILGIVFCCLIVGDKSNLQSAYHLSPELLMLTLGVPYMYTWFLGLFSVVELYTYSQRVGGVVFRKGWWLLISGLASVIVCTILIQYITTLSTWLNSLSLGGILLLLYVLLFLLSLAYIVVALGAKQLTKIEEA